MRALRVAARKSAGRCGPHTDRASAQRALAWLKQEREQVDPTQGRLTLAELSDRYSAAIRHHAAKTIQRKLLIIHRIKSHWPTGRLTQVAKVRPSHVDLWLSRYHFGSASRNLFISCIKEIFALALRDRIIAASPAAHLRYTKRQKRIRATPSFEDFKGIVETIRSQKYNGHDPQESADFVEFLGLAGLGKAEAAALRQSDIDWQRETITTFRPKTKSGFAIPIYPQLKPLLLRRRRDDAPNERLFKINDAKEAIANACRRLNLSHYSHLSFRRMFITRAIERGVDVARLGWIAAQIDLLSRFCKALFAQLRESPILGAKTQSAFHPHAPQTLSVVRVRNP